MTFRIVFRLGIFRVKDNPLLFMYLYTGIIQKYNWEGDVIWEIDWANNQYQQHHDIEILPNGNILAICSEVKTYEELINSGMIIEEEPDITNRGNMDMIVEIEPIGNNSANIVWKWHFWDHLIQDINPDFPRNLAKVVTVE